MKILIATTNQAKINGAKQAFDCYFENYEIEGISVPSDVSEQPVGDDIYLGAKNRTNNLIEYAKQNNIDADFYVAIESGITNQLGKWVIVNVAVIKDKNGYESWGTSAGFPVPDKYVDKIISTNLGEVMDEIFNAQNLRAQKGGIVFLTHDVMSRIDLTKQAFVMALTQFINDFWRD